MKIYVSFNIMMIEMAQKSSKWQRILSGRTCIQTVVASVVVVVDKSNGSIID